jgi:hypothetical protein
MNGGEMKKTRYAAGTILVLLCATYFSFCLSGCSNNEAIKPTAQQKADADARMKAEESQNGGKPVQDRQEPSGTTPAAGSSNPATSHGSK